MSRAFRRWPTPTFYIHVAMILAGACLLYAFQYLVVSWQRYYVVIGEQKLIRGRCVLLVQQAEATLTYLAQQKDILEIQAPATVASLRQAYVTLQPMGVDVVSVIEVTNRNGKERARLHVIAPSNHRLTSPFVGDQPTVRELLETGSFVSSAVFRPVDRNIERAAVFMSPVSRGPSVQGAVSFLIDLDEFVDYLAGVRPSPQQRIVITIDEAVVDPSEFVCRAAPDTITVGGHTWYIHVFDQPTGTSWMTLVAYFLIAPVAVVTIQTFRSRQQHAERELRQLVDLMESAVLRVRGGEIIYANGFAHRCLGYPPGSLVGKSVFDIIPRRDDRGYEVQDMVCSQFSSASAEEVSTSVTPNVRKDGMVLWLAWTNKILSSTAAGTEILCVGNDITELKIAELHNRQVNHQLAVACEQAKEADRQKSGFLSSMSHELRTPLNGILGFIDLLERQFYGPLNEKQIEYVRRIDSCGKHLLRLINDLLDVAKIDAGMLELDLQSTSLVTVVDSAVAIMEELFRAKRLVVYCDVVETCIQADSDRCKQILINLLSNAHKYTSEGGRIHIAAREIHGYVRVSVKDSGVGIAADEQEKIFSEFYQGNQPAVQARKGTGIGLALARRLVEMQGGEIGVISEVGSGSTFWFTLPLEQQSCPSMKFEERQQRSHEVDVDRNPQLLGPNNGSPCCRKE